MEIMESLVEFGTNAVLAYRTMSQRQDNALPEVFLGGYIAPRLYDRFHCRVHIEENYLHLARSCGVVITDEIVSRVGYLRADIAMYPKEPPPAVIEFKILDESTPVSSVLSDYAKVKELYDTCGVTGYLGLLVCQTNLLLEENVNKVKESLSSSLYLGQPQQSADGRWKWRFASAAVSQQADGQGGQPEPAQI